MSRGYMAVAKTVEWETPQRLFDKLNSEFNFTLDPCTDGKNQKCENYFTEEDNGLIQDWSNHSVFMNPPYNDLKTWLEKAYKEGLNPNTKVVCLIPSRTDTRYWHDYCMKAKEIRLIKGRVKFGDGTSPAPFPSAIVVFDGTHAYAPILSAYSQD